MEIIVLKIILFIVGGLVGALLAHIFLNDDKPVKDCPVVNTTVTCEDCKCEVKEENAYKVKVGRKYIDISPNWYYTKHDKSSDPFYYCKRCKPTFSRIELEPDCEYYYKELEVTQDGEPVGYKKK